MENTHVNFFIMFSGAGPGGTAGYRALGKPEIPGLTFDTGILCDKDHLPVVQRGQRLRPAESPWFPMLISIVYSLGTGCIADPVIHSYMGTNTHMAVCRVIKAIGFVTRDALLDSPQTTALVSHWPTGFNSQKIGSDNVWGKGEGPVGRESLPLCTLFQERSEQLIIRHQLISDEERKVNAEKLFQDRWNLLI